MVCTFVLRVWSNIWIVQRIENFIPHYSSKNHSTAFHKNACFLPYFSFFFPFFQLSPAYKFQAFIHDIFKRGFAVHIWCIFRSNIKVNIMDLRNTFWFLFCFFTFRTISKFYPSKLMQCMNHGYQIWFQWPKPIA